MGDPKTITSADDLKFDPRNANSGTERGQDLLREAIEQCGVGRGITVDKHGVVIAGNKTLKAARAAGIPITVVQTDGQELVVVQRTDLDLIEHPTARQLAYYDNRVGEVDLNWNGRQMRQDMLDGVDLSSSFFPNEIDQLTYVEPPPEVNIEATAVDVQDIGEVMVLDVPIAVTGPALPAEEKPDKPQRPSFELVFENITQQIRWTALMRVLRERYPDSPSQADRLSTYLTEIGITA